MASKIVLVCLVFCLAVQAIQGYNWRYVLRDDPAPEPGNPDPSPGPPGPGNDDTNPGGPIVGQEPEPPVLGGGEPEPEPEPVDPEPQVPQSLPLGLSPGGSNGPCTAGGPGLFVDPENCAYFWSCADATRGYRMACPASLKFHSVIKNCMWPQDADC